MDKNCNNGCRDVAPLSPLKINNCQCNKECGGCDCEKAIAPCDNLCDTTNIKTHMIPREEMLEKDWSKFTIAGELMVRLYTKTINSMIEEFNKNVTSTEEGFQFTFNEVFERSGTEDFNEVDGMVEKDERGWVECFDEEGLDWRYYVMEEVLARFEEAGWDVEIDEPQYATREEIRNAISAFGSSFVNFRNNFNGLFGGLFGERFLNSNIENDIEDIKNKVLNSPNFDHSYRIAIEREVGKVVVSMFPADLDEPEDDEDMSEDDQETVAEAHQVTPSKESKPRQYNGWVDLICKIGDMMNDMVNNKKK